MNIVYMAVAAALVSGLAGLAALLRSGLPLTVGSACSSLLNSGLLGGAVLMLWHSSFTETPHALVGICVLIGLGGMPAIDFVLRMVLTGGFSIRFDRNQLDVRPNQPEQATSTETKP